MDSFFDVLQSVPPPFNVAVLIVLIICSAVVLVVSITVVSTSIAEQIRLYGCHRQELQLKRELLDRGMSAEEIEQIICATSDKPPQVS